MSRAVSPSIGSSRCPPCPRAGGDSLRRGCRWHRPSKTTLLQCQSPTICRESHTGSRRPLPGQQTSGPPCRLRCCTCCRFQAHRPTNCSARGICSCGIPLSPPWHRFRHRTAPSSRCTGCSRKDSSRIQFQRSRSRRLSIPCRYCRQWCSSRKTCPQRYCRADRSSTRPQRGNLSRRISGGTCSSPSRT